MDDKETRRRAVMEVIKRNPRLDDLITYCLRFGGPGFFSISLRDASPTAGGRSRTGALRSHSGFVAAPLDGEDSLFWLLTTATKADWAASRSRSHFSRSGAVVGASLTVKTCV